MKTKLTILLIFCTHLLRAQNNCSPSTGSSDLDFNNVSVRIQGAGDMWWDLVGSPKYEVPKGSGKHTMFAGGLWMGGLDNNNQLHVAAQTYRQTGNDYWPGPIGNNGNTNAAACLLYDKQWKVNKSDILNHIANPANPPLSISSWPAKGNDLGGGNIILEEMAPFVDVNGNGTYEPTAGDYPKINGDQAIWWVYNDVGNAHSETSGAPLGFEVRVMAYSFGTNNVLNNTTFYNYNIKNKSINSYNNLYLGFFTDSDLGGYFDDFLGCDSTRNAAIFYNADASDANYGTNIPITTLASVKQPLENNNPVKMSYLGYIANSSSPQGNPSATAHFYNYLTGKWKDGSSWGYNYAFPGSPCDSNQTSMVYPSLMMPGDYRTIQSFGPLTLTPGNCKDITMAVITTFNTPYPNPCFDNIRLSIDSVISLHQNLAVNDLACAANFTNVSELGLRELFKIYPNPSESMLTLSVPALLFGQYNFYAVDGSLSLIGSINNMNTNIDISELQKGLYFVSVSDFKGKVLHVEKFVKQ